MHRQASSNISSHSWGLSIRTVTLKLIRRFAPPPPPAAASRTPPSRHRRGHRRRRRPGPPSRRIRRRRHRHRRRPTSCRRDSPSWKKRVRPSLVSRRLDIPPRKPPRHAAGPVSPVVGGRPGRRRRRSGSSACRCPGSCRSRPCHRRPGRRRRPAAAARAAFGGDEDQRPAVAGRNVVEDRAAARDLAGPPLQAGPVDLRRLGRDRPPGRHPAPAVAPGPPVGRAVRPRLGLIRVSGELLQRDAEDLRRSGAPRRRTPPRGGRSRPWCRRPRTAGWPRRRSRT